MPWAVKLWLTLQFTVFGWPYPCNGLMLTCMDIPWYVQWAEHCPSWDTLESESLVTCPLYKIRQLICHLSTISGCPSSFPASFNGCLFQRFFRYNTMYTLLYFWYYIFVKNKYLRYSCQTYLWMSCRAFSQVTTFLTLHIIYFTLKTSWRGYLYFN